jgi:hypothetical protein
VYESDRQSLLRVDHAPRVDDVLGPTDADQTRKALRAAGPRDHAQEDLGLAQLGVLGGDAEVARHRQLTPAAERVAVDRRDGHLRQPLEPREDVLEVPDPLEHRDGILRGHLLDVRSCREDLLSSPHDHGAHVVVRLGRCNSVIDLRRDLPVERVHLRTVEADGAHAVAAHLEVHEFAHCLAS